MIDPDFIANELIYEALSYVGQMENFGEQNRSNFIDAINKFMGVPLGSSYCQTFAYYCASRVCSKYHLSNPLPKTAGTIDAWNRSKQYQISIGDAEKGCFIYFQDVLDHSHGHVSIYCTHGDNNDFLDIEGNTNDNGSRNGDGIYQRTRTLGDDKYLSILGAVNIPRWIADFNNQSE